MLEKPRAATPLRSCQLEVLRPSTPAMTYIGTVKEARSVNGKIESVEVDRIETNVPTELHQFLQKNGVAAQEINIAIHEMTQHDHNCAAFGWYGGFLYSFTSEVVH